MQGIKISLSFAAFGFILSLLFGFTSHAAFFILLIRALVIALVFAGLGFGFYFTADKFLMDEADSIDVSEGAPAASSQVGTKVDLYVHDEELEADNDGNAFYVDDSSHQMLNNSDLRSTGSISRASPVVSAPSAREESPFEQEAAAAFAAPAANERAAMAEANAGAAESAASFQSAEPAQPADNGGASGESAAASDNAGSAPSAQEGKSELDTLPDMSGFVMENHSSSEENEEGAVESDSGYTTTVSSSHSDGSEYGVRDAEVMAKAISSVLSREES